MNSFSEYVNAVELQTLHGGLKTTAVLLVLFILVLIANLAIRGLTWICFYLVGRFRLWWSRPVYRLPSNKKASRFEDLGPELTVSVSYDMQSKTHVYMYWQPDGSLCGWTRSTGASSVADRHKHGISPEMSIPGSTRRVTGRGSYAVVFFDEQGTVIGNGFRWKDCVVTAAHVAADAFSWGPTSDPTLRTQKMPKRVRRVPKCDVSWFRVSPGVFAAMGVQALKRSRPTSVSSTVMVKCWDLEHEDWVRSMGSATGEYLENTIQHTASTIPGASGCPVLTTGDILTGVHVGSASNGGLYNAFVPFFMVEEAIEKPVAKRLLRKLGMDIDVGAIRPETSSSDEDNLFYSDVYKNFRSKAVKAGMDIDDYDDVDDSIALKGRRAKFAINRLTGDDLLDFVEYGYAPPSDEFNEEYARFSEDYDDDRYGRRGVRGESAKPVHEGGLWYFPRGSTAEKSSEASLVEPTECSASTSEEETTVRTSPSVAAPTDVGQQRPAPQNPPSSPAQLDKGKDKVDVSPSSKPEPARVQSGVKTPVKTRVGAAQIGKTPPLQLQPHLLSKGQKKRRRRATRKAAETRPPKRETPSIKSESASQGTQVNASPLDNMTREDLICLFSTLAQVAKSS